MNLKLIGIFCIFIFVIRYWYFVVIRKILKKRLIKVKYHSRDILSSYYPVGQEQTGEFILSPLHDVQLFLLSEHVRHKCEQAEQKTDILSSY